MMLREQVRDPRVRLLLVTTILVAVGLMFVYSAGSMQALRFSRAETYFFNKQLLSALMGFVALYLAFHMPLESYRRLVVPLYFFTLILLLAVFFFRPINGSHRWLILPMFSIQPSELAKFTAVLYLAHYLDKKEDKLADFSRGFLPASILLGVMGALILMEPDYGTTMLIIAVTLALFFMGGARSTHIIGVTGFIAPFIVTGLLMGYRRGRIMSFLDPWEDRFGQGYQLIQSLAAVGSGGIFGKGVGNSSQKLYFLPEAHTDFIYAIIAEETGMFGSFGILALVVVIIMTGFAIARKHTDRFKRLLTLGLTLMLGIQGLIHICVVIGLLPTKGIGLPFVSYGGTNMVFSLFMMGVILRSAEEAGAADE